MTVERVTILCRWVYAGVLGAVFSLCAFLPPAAAQFSTESQFSEPAEQPEAAPVCSLPSLPEPRTNNAVSHVERDGDIYVASFFGLGAGRQAADIKRDGYLLKVGDADWQRLGDVPVPNGRLAATAVAARGRIWLMGGYSVDASGDEVSEPEMLAFDPITRRFERQADMPVPVDDAVSFVYRDRYIYVVSGWHNVGNVSFVHYYDIETDEWARATDFPGKPVFGHAGALFGDQFVISDGVAVTAIVEGRRHFDMIAQGWQGTIADDDPAVIYWEKLPALPGKPLYRMGAATHDGLGLAVFAGGSETAYNYDSIGYEGGQAEPSAHVFAWNFLAQRWDLLPDKAQATMDHRGLVAVDGSLFVVGGMLEGGTVTDRATLAFAGQRCVRSDGR